MKKYLFSLSILFLIFFIVLSYLLCDLGYMCVVLDYNNVLVAMFVISLIFIVFIYAGKTYNELENSIIISEDTRGVFLKENASWETVEDDIKQGKYRIKGKRAPTANEAYLMKLVYSRGWSKNKIAGVTKGYAGFYGYKDKDVLYWINEAIK